VPVPPRILAVDDEPDLLQLIRRSLEPQGMIVLEAHDGQQALQRIQHDHPDLVLLDLGLPDEDGSVVLERIRAASSLPVIVVTGRSGDAQVLRSLQQGADDCVVKPFRPAELGARIQAILRRRSS
jgi:DNA-binding response OmpR family regulator